MPGFCFLEKRRVQSPDSEQGLESGAMNIETIQRALREQGIEAWLFFDHHHRDPIAYRILGLDENAHVTRRWFYLIPAHGEPTKLVHRIESGRLDALPGKKAVYSSWDELVNGIEALVARHKQLAMQYSPQNAIMYISLVDAGTVELLRGMGKEIVSSANLISQFEAVLNEEQRDSHYQAQKRIDMLLAEGFKVMGHRARNNDPASHEYAMVEWLAEAMRREGIIWEHGPNVSVGANSSDSHYEPTTASSKPIRKGDFVLVDIWGRMDEPGSVFYDITWTGVVDREPTAREVEVFEAVRDARDAAIAVVTSAFAAKKPLQGWQVDDAARAVIQARGLGEYFTHRTGHNIATELHGNGANLDNLETHDERLVLPNTCFSVEPGVYLPEFGVRSEVNMLTWPDKAAVTGRVQTDLLRI
jgi:Xaa-Pro dipeptidase